MKGAVLLLRTVVIAVFLVLICGNSLNYGEQLASCLNSNQPPAESGKQSTGSTFQDFLDEKETRCASCVG